LCPQFNAKQDTFYDDIGTEIMVLYNETYLFIFLKTQAFDYTQMEMRTDESGYVIKIKKFHYKYIHTQAQHSQKQIKYVQNTNSKQLLSIALKDQGINTLFYILEFFRC